MGRTVRYRKPNMANLSGKLGKHIINQIIESPAPDRKKLKAESEALRKRIIEQMKSEKSSHA